MSQLTRRIVNLLPAALNTRWALEQGKRTHTGRFTGHFGSTLQGGSERKVKAVVNTVLLLSRRIMSSAQRVLSVGTGAARPSAHVRGQECSAVEFAATSCACGSR
eukprot:3883557-Pleurochrysis_carterae.AAC.1